MAGSGPAMTGDRKFANVFKVPSAGGNIRVIKYLYKKMLVSRWIILVRL
jgi:hypothetical protein